MEPALADDPVADDVWREVVRHALPILRTIPPGSRDPFFCQLGLELDLLNCSAGDVAVYRLAAFCRIVLQPVGRGGGSAALPTSRGSSEQPNRPWAAGQYGFLVREYLSLALE